MNLIPSNTQKLNKLLIGTLAFLICCAISCQSDSTVEVNRIYNPTPNSKVGNRYSPAQKIDFFNQINSCFKQTAPCWLSGETKLFLGIETSQKVYAARKIEILGNVIFLFSVDLEDSKHHKYYDAYLRYMSRKGELLGKDQFFVSGNEFNMSICLERFLYVHSEYVDYNWNGELGANQADSVEHLMFHFIGNDTFIPVKQMSVDLKEKELDLIQKDSAQFNEVENKLYFQLVNKENGKQL